MAFRQLQSLVQGLRKDRAQDQKNRRRNQARRRLAERLEDRRMLAGPELLAIRPDSGALLRSGDTLNVAPREFNLLFQGGANLNEASINANTVRLVRSGGDGLFDGIGDVNVALGFVGLETPGDNDPTNLQKIVVRPASSATANATDPAFAFPDDTYQIQIIGAGPTFLSNNSGERFSNGTNLATTFRLDRGAQVVSVVPQPTSRNTQQINLTATGGTYRIQFGGQTTGAIAFDASNASIRNALTALSNVDANDVQVTGAREVTFRGRYAGEQSPLMTIDSSGLTGGLGNVVRLERLSQASDQIVLYFDDQQLNAAEVTDPKFYRLIDTAGSLTANDDQVLLPSTVDYDRASNKVILTFANDLPEGNYRLDVGQSGGVDDLLADALVVGTLSNTTPFVTNQILGDANGVSNFADDVDLFKVDLKFGAALSVEVTPQSPNLSLRARLIDRNGTPVPGATMTTPVGTPFTLNVNITAENPYFIEIVSANGNTGAYRLNASVTNSPLVVNDNNSTINTATSLGSLGAATVTINSQIQPQSIPLPPLPGGEDEPGHRQIQREAHIESVGTTPTLPQATRVVEYYFPASLGTDASGGSYQNFITETEKQIVRDIFEVYASLSGYEFIEAQGVGSLMIGKGNLQALDPTIGPNDGVAGLGGPSAVVINNALYNQANRFYGDGFSIVMFHEIGHALGLGHSYDQPSIQGTGVPNDVLPGDVDVIHLRRIVPPNSTDIDMFSFALERTGQFSAEVFAERLSTPSLLNSVLTLYRQNGAGDLELVARNDQYFGADAFLNLQLEPGTYFIGVSSTGNSQYDPRVADSGFGGTTDGAYELKLNFIADRNDSLRDASGTAVDGDADGTPGGVYSFWFQASNPANTIYVDKATTAATKNGALATPYDTISAGFAAASSRIVIPTTANATNLTGQTFVVDDGINAPVTFTFNGGSRPINLIATDGPAQIASRIRTAVIAARTAGALSATLDVNASGQIVTFQGIDKLDISGSEILLKAPNLVRIVGNGGADADLTTPADARPYLIGLSTSGAALADGAEFLVPQGVTVMIQAGALIKMRKANLDAGSSAADVNRAGGALQLLGTPNNPVYLRSYHDDTFGGNSDGVGPLPSSGDFGGVVFRDDSDLESSGIFLNYVNHADIRHGGGKVFVGSSELSFSSIHLINARPTVNFNRVSSSFTAAMSASPNSFEDTLGRIGPDVYGNFLQNNTIDGLFIRVETPLGGNIDKLSVSGRFDDTDIVHVLQENLIIAGGSGGPVRRLDGTLQARAAGRLVVDAGIVLKLSKARIEVERGTGSLIAEGTTNSPVIFTSLADDRYGGSGSFNSDRNASSTPAPADWGGLFFGEVTSGSIDQALIAFGGGVTPIEGGAASFNAVEIHQADVRIANSVLQSNASGQATGVRNGRGANGSSVIYVRGSQPTILNNTIIDNLGPAININANSLSFVPRADRGRSMGEVDLFEQFDDNHGPLVRLNRLENNTLNGMLVRGEVLTTAGVWDDTDIVHVLRDLVTVDNLHTYGGLTLQSSNFESLVIKLSGANAGFTATGTPVEIIDRVGGTIHVLGTVGHPVILTDLNDDSVGAGFTPSGAVANNTDNSATPTTGTPGAWRGFLFDEFSNDRNVAVLRELENPITNRNDVNYTPELSQLLGTLAPNEKSGDEQRRLGFQVKGYISPNDPNDIDVYSFIGTAGTNVWLDIDRTNTSLDAILEVINPLGTVVARSVRSSDPTLAGSLNALTLTQNPLKGGDFYTQNFRDPGLYYTLPTSGTYYVRVRSNPASLPANRINTLAGESSGEYQLQVRLRQVDEFPGSTVQFADIRFAQTGIDLRGLPSHSPLIGEAGELEGDNNSFDGSQVLVNLLQTDMAALGLSGALSSANDVDWYTFDLQQTGVQTIPGVNDGSGTIAVVLDIDYADQVSADTTIAVYDSNQRLVYVGRESNVQDDQPVDATGNINDLSRGSLGNKDPYVGPIHLVPGQRYYVSVMSDRQLPSALTGAFYATPAGNAANALVRLEPVNSLFRVVEDHIGSQGFRSFGSPITPLTPAGLFDISSATALANHVMPFTFGDVQLYVATDFAGADDGDSLYTVNPFSATRLTQVSNNNSFVGGQNDIQDIVIRSDGRMFGYQRQNATTGRVGALVELNPETGAIISTQADNIDDQAPTPNTSVYNTNLGSHLQRAEQFTTSNEVDAFTFQRRGTTGPFTAPVPIYDTFYSVRESATSSKLYRGRQNGDATPSNNPGENRYGVMGNIQPAGVTYASFTLDVFDNSTPVNRTQIRFESKLPGSAGNTINLNIVRPNNTATSVQSVVGNTITLNIGGTGTGGPSAGAIVDAINNNAAASALVTAVIVGGNANGNNDGNNGTAAVTLSSFGGFLTGGSVDSVVAPLSGRVTGLSFGNFNSTGNLYGVTSAGEFLVINPTTGTVIRRVDTANVLGVTGLSFQGLALGPQNVEGGKFANTLFAITSDSRLVAFDLNGNGVLAFDSAANNSTQVVRVDSGVPTNAGFFTLTFENNGVRETTAPISVDAPSTVSVNEQQAVSTVAYNGSFTLSFVDDQGAISSPVANIAASTANAVETLVVEDASDFPATPFVIRVQNEQMLVTSVVGNSFTVTRGFNGTTAAAHPDTATVFEVVNSTLTSALAAPTSSTLTAAIDNQPTTNTLTVVSAGTFPAVPFTIQVDQEQMLVSSVAGNTLTVTRAQNGSTIAAHALGAQVRVIGSAITVADGTPYGAGGFNIRIGNEDLRVLSRVGNVLNVIRGVNGTTPATHAAGATVFKLDTTAAIPYNATAAQVQAALAALPGIGVGNVQVTFGPLTGSATNPVTVEFVGELAAKNLQPLTADRSGLTANERQQITLDPTVTGGTFRLQFQGQQTVQLPFNATNGAIQAALEALPAIGAGNVLVTGGALPGAPITIEFVGARGSTNVGQVTVVANLLDFNERQEIVFDGGPTGGTFRLLLNDPLNGVNNVTTGDLPFNITAPALQQALNALTGLAGNVLVTGGPAPGTPLVVEFTGGLTARDMQLFTFTNNLTGGTPGITINTLADPNPSASQSTLQQGSATAVSVVQGTNGILSVFDALVALPSINPADIQVAGVLQGTGALVRFQGQFAGLTPNALIVDNFLMQNGSQANVTPILPGPDVADNFISDPITGLVANPVGLAFSPLDFNLWHPTTRRGNDAGHGINPSADGSRAPGRESVNIITPGGTRTFNESNGGVSFYFGFEQYLANPDSSSQSYLNYSTGAGQNTQYGIRNTEFHADLSSNASIVNSYNMPGGAFGSLTTNSFSLVGATAADRPTLYFNYFLETQNHGGSNVSSDPNDPFRDSARVFASIDGGVTWSLVATNNSTLSGATANVTSTTAELPGFLSHLSDAGLNSANPRSEVQQIVQELMDNTGQWRQARVDLSQFAGQNVRLRVDFSTAGAMNDPSLGLTDSRFGEFTSATRSIRSGNNAFEGFYLDDIIVGYAERGEMVTGAVPDSSITNLFATGARTRDIDPAQFPDPTSGPYQLEVRRTGEYQLLDTAGTIIASQFNSNDRQIDTVTRTAEVTFEAGSTIPSLTPVDLTLGSTNITAAQIAPWTVVTDASDAFTGTRSLGSATTYTAGQDVSVFQATANSLGSTNASAGVIRFAYKVESATATDGLRFFINGVAQSLAGGSAEIPSPTPQLATGTTEYRVVEFAFGGGNPLLNGADIVFTWLYDGRLSPTRGVAFIDKIELLQGGTGLLADRNRERPQGIFIIDSNFITDSSVRGINVQPGTTEAGGSVPHPGSLINFPQQNVDRLVPGAVIQNNVITGSSGIRFAGETAASPQRPVPFGRIVNNTLVGSDRTGVGIEVVGLSSPTLLNNVLTDLGTGIVNGGTNTVIRSNFFQNNAANGAAGTAATNGGATGSPFINAAQRNYYLQPNSTAVDSSQNAEQDRFNFVTFKRELGIPESPIVAPERDVYGQLRIDSSSSPGGGGASVFKDRGAVDRSDVDAPYAKLLNPVDNDAAGLDRDSNDTVVHLTNPLLENFRILLGDGRGPNSPFEGTGVNGLTVSNPAVPTVAASAVTVFHNSTQLTQGIDYSVGYNPLSGELLLSPLSSLWAQNGVYTIVLNNTQITDLAGNRLRSNQTDGSTKFFVLMPDVRLDFGDAPASYGSTLGSNAARHTIQAGATPRLGVRVDSEVDGQPSPASDDTAQSVIITTLSPLFTVTPIASGRQIIVSEAIAPVGGEQLIVQMGARSVSFELVRPGFAPQRGFTPVQLAVDARGAITDDAAAIATKLIAAIQTELVVEGNSDQVSVDTTLTNAVNIVTLDDEDGAGIGTFTRGGTTYGVFLQPGSPATTTDPAAVLGFLNPLDPLGANISVTVTGTGFLNAWIDFNGNGTFDNTEQVFNNTPVVDGVNTLRIITPAGTSNKTTWARFRVSETGNLDPTGIAIGGEVEDYSVQIINVPLPTPFNDSFTVNEDEVLNTTTDLTLPSVMANDNIPAANFLPIQFFVGQQPANGTVTVLDPTSGRFIYTPRADFYGTDTFTYRLAGQSNVTSGTPTGVTYATVTITVNPVNDTPAAQQRNFVTREDVPLVITAADLLQGALPDALPQYPVGSPAAPFDETNQQLNVVSLQTATTTITAANAASGPFAIARGTITPRFNATTGYLIDLIYTPNADVNADTGRTTAGPRLLDSFIYTIEDDGVLQTPAQVDLPGPYTRLRASSTAFIQVTPQNDAPSLSGDSVSVGLVGATNSNTPWRVYFTSLSQETPVPTEDAPLTIPSAFLLRNDIAGNTTSTDENGFINGNDGALRVVGVTPVTPGLAVELDVDGNVLLTPPDDIYGDVIFTYEAEDQGVDEAVDNSRVVAGRRTTATVTVTLQPVNDKPVAFPRAIPYTESATAGTGPAFTFNAARLVAGVTGENPSIPGQFDSALGTPFNEAEQALRVVAFRTSRGTVDVSSLPTGTGTLTLASDAGGTFEFDFSNGAFTAGRFITSADYNQNQPFAPQELLEYLIADNGRTTRPQGGGVVVIPSERADQFATITFTVAPTNDAPVFTSPSIVNVLERDDDGETVVANFITNILPGPATAQDELLSQTVRFEIIAGAPGSNVPNGLMRLAPTIGADGTLRVYPSPDAVGNAVYVFEAVDQQLDPTTGQNVAGFTERRTRATVTIAVRPVNDAPRVNGSVAGTSLSQSADEGWSVATDGAITFTMKEDNTGGLGVTSPYTILVNRDPATVGYQRIGLLDVFNAGPANEEDSTQGGSQILRLLSFQATTTLGGTIRAVEFNASGDITRLQYTPPLDYNISQGDVDSFTYVVQDNQPTDGETYNLSTGSLVEDRRRTTGTARFRLLPVNDKPQFDVPESVVSVLEDTGAISFEDFVTNIFAGRPGSAFDEIDLTNGQNVKFSVTAVTDIAGLFSTSPAISDEGVLSFTTAPDAFGTAIFEVRATDDGPDNAVRGDIVSSDLQRITIHIRPVNDRPVVNTTTPLTFSLNEDAMVLQPGGQVINRGTLIPLRGTTAQPGLLDVFNVGPTTGPGSESANVTPGGRQTLSLTTPIPAGTVNGGILTQERDSSGNLIGLRYTPRENFNGVDSFVYGVIDNGQSVDIDGNASNDPREAFTTVTLQVIPRNDAPVFGGAVSVSVDEDATTTPVTGQTIIANWATNIQAGPAGAEDENAPVTGQTVTFTVNPVAGNPAGLFTAVPTVSADGTLTFRTATNATGSAVFTVVASDNGTSNPPLEFNTSIVRTFTITVRPVNDAPNFTPGGNIVVDEDSGQYGSPTPWATNIVPGPADEISAGQSVVFNVTIPEANRALFATDGQPRLEVVSSTDENGVTTVSGFLRFTVATNASGSVPVTVVATDSAGASAAPVTFTITINEVNDVPVANSDSFSGNEDNALNITAAQILSNDEDSDQAFNPSETLTIVGLPANSLNGAAIRVLTNGTIQYDPRGSLALQALAPGQTRADTFTYRVQDAAGRQSNLATVTVNVAGRNDAPILLPDTPTLTPQGVTTISPLLNDSDIDGTIDPSTLVITLQPSFGSVDVRTDGTLVYTPFVGFRGSDVIRYSVADNLGLRTEQTITIDINQAPVANNDIGGTFRDVSVDINVAGNDTDSDGTLNRESIVITRAPVRGTAVAIGGGLVRYVPETGYIGSDSFQYTIQDNAGRTSNVATVNLQVVGSTLQNPQNFTDVNASGQTSPIDALLVINRISRGRREGVTGPIIVLPTDRGPNYFDTDGNGQITPNDALRVINQIARDNRTRLAGSEGEASDQAPLSAVAAPPSPAAATGSSSTTSAANDLAVTEFAQSTLVADFSLPVDQVVTTLAADRDSDSEEATEAHNAAIDAAWADVAKF